jgi:hypothetical protein
MTSKPYDYPFNVVLAGAAFKGKSDFFMRLTGVEPEGQLRDGRFTGLVDGKIIDCNIHISDPGDGRSHLVLPVQLN